MATQRVIVERASFRQVLRESEFRALWITGVQSRFGDQLCKVALGILVYTVTSSTLLTGITYAMTYLPPLLSAPLLSGLADRHSRRTIMTVTDLIRASLAGLMAIPGMPIVALTLLLIPLVALQPLFSAARNATLPNVLPGERYMVGTGIMTITDGMAQLGGFIFGGVIVGALGVHTALMINAVTFTISAAIIRLCILPHRPIGSEGGAQSGMVEHKLSGGARLVWRTPQFRNLVLLIWVYGFYIVPEGLAIPYAVEMRAGTFFAGLLMAADPIGTAVGAFVFMRWITSETRSQLIGPLAIAAGVPLMIFAIHPSPSLAVTLLVISGFCSTHVILAQATLIQSVPDVIRAQVAGLTSAGLQTLQGAGIVVGGALAVILYPALTIAVCGGVGAICAMFILASWKRVRAVSLSA